MLSVTREMKSINFISKLSTVNKSLQGIKVVIPGRI